MIIDLILDRRAGDEYDPKCFIIWFRTTVIYGLIWPIR